MKILLIHCHYRLPGGEDAVFAAERALLEQHGHTVVVYERSNEEAAHGAAKALLPFRAVWNRRAARDVRNIMEQQHIDAVHIHNTLLLLSPAVVRAAKKCGVPVVLTLHNFRLFCPNGILLRDGRVCEDCPHHGLHCALRHRCYRGSRAQTLVVVAAYWLHRVLGTWRGIAITTPTEFDREKLLEFNKIHPTFDENRLVVKPNPVTVPTGPVTPWEEKGLKPMLTNDDAAKMLGVSKRTLQRMRSENRIDFIKIGNQCRYQVEAIERMVEERTIAKET